MEAASIRAGSERNQTGLARWLEASTAQDRDIERSEPAVLRVSVPPWLPFIGRGRDQSTKRYLIKVQRAGKPSFQVIFFPSE